MNIYHSSGRSSRLRHPAAPSHNTYDNFSRQTSVLAHPQPPSPSDEFLQEDPQQPDAANSVIYTAYPPSPPNSAQSSQNSFNNTQIPLETKFDSDNSNNTLSYPPPLIHGEELEHQSLETAIYTRLCHPPSQDPSPRPPDLIPIPTIPRCIQLKAENGASTQLWHASPNLDNVHWPHPPNSKKSAPEGTTTGAGFPQPPSPISPPESALAPVSTGEYRVESTHQL